jgi:hypothetical protein
MKRLRSASGTGDHGTAICCWRRGSDAPEGNKSSNQRARNAVEEPPVPETTEQPSVVKDETMIVVDVSEESIRPKLVIIKRTSLFRKKLRGTSFGNGDCSQKHFLSSTRYSWTRQTTCG